MCGRFTLTTTSSELADVFDLDPEDDALEFAPRYNIAPTQAVAVVRQQGTANALGWLHWGLIPAWAKDRAVGARMINARSESAAQKPAFRDALRRRRCIVPASGFYEWGRRGKHQGPHWFAASGGELLALAGLWERWEGEGDMVESCTILTMDANPVVAPVHERMPVILAREQYAAWLDPGRSDLGEIGGWPDAGTAPDLTIRKVTRRVNDVAFDAAACIEAAPDEKPDWGPLFGGE